MKKLTAILLMVCLLLTLASCGKKDEAETGVPARTFATETDVSTLMVTVQGGNFIMEQVRQEPSLAGEVTRLEDGTYILEGVEQAGPMTLTPFRNGYYKPTDAEGREDTSNVLVRLDGGHSFSAHGYMTCTYSFLTEGERRILRMENLGMVMEVWNEGTAFTGYQVARGTYNLRDRGETKLLDLNVSWGGYDTTIGSGMLMGDKLEITLDGEAVSMSRMAENTYFGMLDGEEVILRLKEDGMAEMLSADESEDVRFTCVPGEKLEVISDEMVMFSFQVEGNTLTINSDQESNGVLPLVLTEVK